MGRFSRWLKKALGQVAGSNWWKRLRLVYWPRYVTWPIREWRFRRLMNRVAREAEWRRQQAWQFLQRTDLSPEDEELAGRYFKAMRDYFQVCQDLKREISGRRK